MVEGLSVFFPCYNEEKNIRDTVNKAVKVLKNLTIPWEIIIINDGSKDQTATVVNDIASKNAKIRVIHHSKNVGYGGSLKSGFYNAKYPWIVFTDADGQFDFSELSIFIEKQKETEADLVIGYYLKRQVVWLTRFTSKIWELIVYMFFGLKVRDIDCGFKLISKKVIDTIPRLESERGAFISSELLIKAKQAGFKIIEIGVHHFPRVIGQGTARNLNVIIKSFMDLGLLWGKIVWPKIKWETLAIGLILLVSVFTRLYKIDQYMTFLGDEGRDVMVVRNMIVNFRPALLGPGTSIGNMYLGPLYYYLMTIPLVLANFSPIGPAISVAMFGVATVGLLWWWSRQLVGRVPALLLSTLYSLSPTIIIYSRSSWNPNIMPFFALLTMYGVWKVWRFGYWRWFIITMVSFAFVLNSHYLGLLLAPVIGLFVLRAPKNKSYKKYLILGFGVWALLMSPLVFFDIRHDYMNFKNILHFFTNRQETVNLKVYKAIPNLWTIWEMVLNSLVFAKNALVSFWGSLAILGSLFLVFKSKPKRDFWFVFIWMLVGLIGLGLYKQHIYDHYFGFLYPVVFLLLGYILNIYNKYLVAGVFVFLLGLNLLNNPLRFSPNSQWQRTQDMANFIIRESGGKSFNLALLSKGNYDMSYRYALVLRNAPYKTLHEENTGQLFTICEYDDCKPIGNPLWEIAGFGWAQIDDSWTLPSGLKLYKLGRYVH